MICNKAKSEPEFVSLRLAIIIPIFYPRHKIFVHNLLIDSTNRTTAHANQASTAAIVIQCKSEKGMVRYNILNIFS